MTNGQGDLLRDGVRCGCRERSSPYRGSHVPGGCEEQGGHDLEVPPWLREGILHHSGERENGLTTPREVVISQHSIICLSSISRLCSKHTAGNARILPVSRSTHAEVTVLACTVLAIFCTKIKKNTKGRHNSINGYILLLSNDRYRTAIEFDMNTIWYRQILNIYVYRFILFLHSTRQNFPFGISIRNMGMPGPGQKAFDTIRNIESSLSLYEYVESIKTISNTINTINSRKVWRTAPYVYGNKLLGNSVGSCFAIRKG